MVHTFEEFKEALIQLACGKGLPLDLNELSYRDLFPIPAEKALVGYQAILNTDGSAAMHPGMHASFCVYNKAQIDNIIAGDRNYTIIPIFDGDIEDPEVMFQGEPDDDFFVGDDVLCNGQEDTIVRLVTPEDPDNYNAGYRYVLLENGTQTPGTISKLKIVDE